MGLKLLPRERLSQLPRPLLRLMGIQRLTHGCTTLDFMDMDMDTMDMLHSSTAMLHTPTPMSTLTMASHTLTMARDLLMPSQRPRLMLTHISSMVDTTDLTL